MKTKVLFGLGVAALLALFTYTMFPGDDFTTVTTLGEIHRWCASGDERVYAFNVGKEQHTLYYVDMKKRTVAALHPTVDIDEVCPLAVPFYPREEDEKTLAPLKVPLKGDKRIP